MFISFRWQKSLIQFTIKNSSYLVNFIIFFGDLTFLMLATLFIRGMLGAINVGFYKYLKRYTLHTGTRFLPVSGSLQRVL